MNRLKRLSFSTLFLLAGLSLYAAGRPAVSVQPSWVKPVAVDYAATSLDADAEDGYSDLLHEQQVSLATQEQFVHKAFHVLTAAGVQNRSQVSVEYDPSYQQLFFHNIRILRDGKPLDRLDLSRIKTIQQEKELDRYIYNGSLTAILFLDDLRKGDVVEYSYTLKGFNPIFRNRYADVFNTAYSVPVYTLSYRLLVPQGRSVKIANSRTGVQPAIVTTPTETAYEWTLHNQQPVRQEKSVPDWYDVYPMVMVSEFATWKDVVDWALPLFPFDGPLAPELQQKVAALKNAYATQEAQLLAALRFVQDDVRYTGIEMGESSHRPHPPAQVFRQRFGDCKDKAYLLCTLLRALGIEAYPVFINTEYKKGIRSWLPSPTAFDHTTVCAVLNGKTYWFDATASHQRGALADISFPDYQAGLVVKPGMAGLATIPLQDRGRVQTKEVFTIERLGPVKLVVTTSFSGSFADNIRYDFQNSSVGEIQKNYREMYTPYFKKLDADSLRYEDNEATGVFTTREYYTIRNFWKDEGGKNAVALEPYLINSVIRKPEDDDRQMPFALPFPSRYNEEIEVHLPGDWPITESTHRFQTDAFVFDCTYEQAASNMVRLKYRYESLQDSIAPDDISNYLNEWRRAENVMAFNLTDDFAEPEPVASRLSANGNRGFTAAYIVLGFCALATFLYRRRRQRGF